MYKIIKLFLLLIFVLHTYVYNNAWAATACDTTCDNGKYCNTTVGVDPMCASCTNQLPNYASWNGPGQDDDPTSCPWKCNTGYYKYDDLCYQCPYGSTPTSDGKGCYWENVTFSDNKGSVPMPTGTLQLSESLLEKARAQQ